MEFWGFLEFLGGGVLGFEVVAWGCLWGRVVPKMFQI